MAVGSAPRGTVHRAEHRACSLGKLHGGDAPMGVWGVWGTDPGTLGKAWVGTVVGACGPYTWSRVERGLGPAGAPWATLPAALGRVREARMCSSPKRSYAARCKMHFFPNRIL